MSVIPVDAIYKGLKKGFKYTPPDDRWDELLAPGKSNYDEVMNVPVTIRITRIYHDLLLNRVVEPEEILTVTRERAELLIERGFAVYAGQATTV